LVERIGQRLRKIRLQWKLSLREVEERSVLCARKWGDPAFRISASWLDRVERGEHELAVNKLLALADIYSIPPQQLLASLHPGNTPPALLDQPSSPNATILLTGGPLEERAQCLLPGTPGLGHLPAETTLFPIEEGPSLSHYKRSVIGKRDRTLEPMIPAGSIVQVDTRERTVSPRKVWKNEFERPIYFLATPDGYVCGWCELDRNEKWLTLIPHPMSPVSSQRWKYRKEVEILGRVVAVSMRLLPDSQP
jgi:transcriptional regulator with XRE-family HTH domain